MNDRAFLDEISEFVGSTLQSGESIVVVATEETRGGIGERLKARGIDVSAMREFQQYVVMDALISGGLSSSKPADYNSSQCRADKSSN
jgi:KaiC/GvpD/RAD55 family RecA-like ATPase